MTTKVTLETCNWPVAVVTTDTDVSTGAIHQSSTIVPPNTTSVQYVHATRKVEFIELPVEETNAPAA